MPRFCPKCNTTRPKVAFHKDSKRKDGLQLWCKDCGKAAKKHQYHNGRRDAVRLSARKTTLKTKYGLTLEDYERMFNEQGGVCLICQQPETVRSNPNGVIDSLRVDHCHTTGKVRGLLCSECNFGISKFKDDPMLMLRAGTYVQGWQDLLFPERIQSEQKS